MKNMNEAEDLNEEILSQVTERIQFISSLLTKKLNPEAKKELTKDLQKYEFLKKCLEEQEKKV
jgi:hypothetical protein